MAKDRFSKAEHNLAITFINAAMGIKVVNRNYMNDISYCYGPEPFIKLYISLYATHNKIAAHEVWKRGKNNFPDHQGISDHQILFRGM
jgi:hypothetical protein